MDVYDDGTKKYIMQRDRKQNKKVISYPSEVTGNRVIKVFVLFSDNCRKYVENMQKKLENKRINLTKGLEETQIVYEDKIDILNNFDYVAIIVSEEFLEDLELLEILEANFEVNGNNKKMLPIIVWKDLYNPETRAKVLETLQCRINGYKNDHFDDDFSGNIAEDLKRMQQILKMLKSFLKFAVKRDRKTALKGSEKLLKYICYDRKIDLKDMENIGGNKKTEINQTFNINSAEQINIANDNANINVAGDKEH